MPSRSTLSIAPVPHLVLALIGVVIGCGTSTSDGSGARGVAGGAGAALGGASAGAGAASAGAGAASAGAGGAAAGSSGASAGAGGFSAGSGGAGAGSSGFSAGSGGGNAGSAGSGGGAPFSCGSQMCGSLQYCVNPCCGGNAPACIVKPDAGTCPVGTHAGCTTGIQCAIPNDCCQYDPCTPPPPYCSDTLPTGCLLQGQRRSCSVTCG